MGSTGNAQHCSAELLALLWRHGVQVAAFERVLEDTGCTDVASLALFLRLHLPPKAFASKGSVHEHMHNLLGINGGTADRLLEDLSVYGMHCCGFTACCQLLPCMCLHCARMCRRMVKCHTCPGSRAFARGTGGTWVCNCVIDHVPQRWRARGGSDREIHASGMYFWHVATGLQCRRLREIRPLSGPAGLQVYSLTLSDLALKRSVRMKHVQLTAL